MRHHLLLALGGALAVASLLGCSDQPGAAADTTGPALDVGERGSTAQDLREGALYVAELHPLNAGIQKTLDPDSRTPHGVAEGKAYFRVVNGMLGAVVDVKGAEPADAAFPEGLHPQHIHEASRCPTMSADVNGDGIVDVIEGLPFYGPIMIPLDGDLADTSSQIPTFPVAMGARGAYHYTATASVASLVQALHHPLDLPSRHVVIHGMDLKTPLPSTVASLPGVPAQLTIPIACGELREAR
jgi:hypothetical protein